MKRQLFSFLVLLSFVVSVSAQKAQVARTDATEQNLRHTIEYLASDKLEGRRTGEAGATIAAGYITNQFANFKLKPGYTTKNGKPSFLQPFPYVTGVEMAKTGNEFQLKTHSDGGVTEVDPNGQIKPVGFSPNGTVANANVVFVGFGIVSAEQKFDDYTRDGKDVDVKGKVVLIFDGTLDNDNPHSPFGRFDVRTKALIAKEHGAIGVLLISREDKFDDDRLTRMGYDQSLGEAALPTFVISRSVAQTLLGVTSGDLKTVEYWAANKNGTSERPRVDIRDTRPTVSFKVNLVKKSVDAYNVIGILPGNDPVLKNEAIVIGAHYDHLGHGGQGSLAANSTEVHHGADDNASGTAAIIEMARAFAKEKKNKRMIIFIAFSGEEEGLFGSKYYVNNPVFPIENTVAMINLDMVGRLHDDKLTIGGIGTASEWKDLVNKINSTNSNVASLDEKDFEIQRAIYDQYAKLGVRGVKVTVKDGVVTLTGTVPKAKYALAIQKANEAGPKKIINQITPGVAADEDVYLTPPFALQLNEDGFGPSDHSSFYGKKIPVLFFFTGTHNDYHKPSDTADKINYAGEVSVISYIEAIELAIDQNPQRPTYTVAKTTMAGGRSGFNISLGTIPNYADSTDGLLLDGVRDASPAAKAGVKAGDKVVKLAGHDIRNVSDYTFVLGEMKAGVEYEIVVLRGGERLTLKITPVKRQ